MQKFRHYYLYFTVFVTGAVVLIIEILGTRILAPFYGSTIFVWSSLLSVALGFLALGYLVGGNWVDKKPHFTNLYSIVFLAGITITLAVKTSQPILVLSDRFGLQLGPLAASLLLFSVPLFFLGMVTPFAIRLRTHLIEKVGLRSGSIFAIATIGSLVGALLSGFVLIPLMPISIIFFVSSAVLVIVSTVGWILTREKKSIAHIVLAVILVYITIFMPASKSRTPQTKTVLLHENTFYGDIKIIGSETQKCLFVNGGSQSCIKLQEPQEPVALFVMQAKELMQALPENSRVLLLGLGGGAIVAAAPEHVTIDSVEIDPRIAELAQTVFNVYPDSQRTVIVDDARRFIRKVAAGSYDLIIEDIALGSSIPYYIFSKESLTDMERILKP